MSSRWRWIINQTQRNNVDGRIKSGPMEYTPWHSFCNGCMQTIWNSTFFALLRFPENRRQLFTLYKIVKASSFHGMCILSARPIISVGQRYNRVTLIIILFVPIDLLPLSSWKPPPSLDVRYTSTPSFLFRHKIRMVRNQKEYVSFPILSTFVFNKPSFPVIRIPLFSPFLTPVLSLNSVLLHHQWALYIITVVTTALLHIVSMNSQLTFITHLPAVFRAPGTGCGTRETYKHTCPLRAMAGASSPPPPPSSGDQGNGKQEGEGLSGAQATLEKLLSVEMKPSEGRDGQCPCIWCNGTKQRRCSWCEGKGVRHEIITKSWEELSSDIEKLQSGEATFMEAPQKIPVTCSACSGSKKLRCAYCRGSGIGSYGHAY